MTATSLLIVLDGWGHSDTPEHNAIFAANTPTWDRLWRDAPHTLISGSGTDVGLPEGQMGNSEVGHMNLGAGRVVFQDLTRIDRAIADGSFARNPALTSAIDTSVDSGRVLHVFGLLSPGGVHSHENQIAALIELAAQRGAKVFVHAFLDGRDTPPRSAEPSLARTEKMLRELGCGRIASLCGRYYAMDRDQRWDRIELAYEMLVSGSGTFEAADPVAGLEAAYARGEGDEFVQPTTIASASEPAVRIEDGDSIIFMNFRADRARQLTRAFVDAGFDAFQRSRVPSLGAFVMLTRYADDIDTACAFEPEPLHNTLGEYLADLGKRQLRIAETEKYAHVTFFFSGGREQPFEGEDRQLIASPRVATYDLKPEMSAPEVTDTLVAAIRSGEYDAIICNFANADMVGHTGLVDAAVTAVETIDACLARIVDALRETGGQCLITADHGNVERMQDPTTGVPHTAHTSEPVPLVYIGPRDISFDDGGLLSDVAPTLLDLMELPIPSEMTGRSLLHKQGIRQRA